MKHEELLKVAKLLEETNKNLLKIKEEINSSLLFKMVYKLLDIHQELLSINKLLKELEQEDQETFEIKDTNLS